MIKVMHVIHGLNTGGAETLVKEYALRLDKTKFDVTILCFRHYLGSPYEKILKDNRIKVIYLEDYNKEYGIKFFSNICKRVTKILLIKKIIHIENPQILHFHLFTSKYIKFAHPNKETKLFYTLHGDFKRYLKIDAKDFKSLKWLIKHYHTQIICLHEQMKEEINHYFNINNTVVLNNGIDFDKYNNIKDKNEVRKSLNIPIGAFVIGNVGRLSKVKNHAFLIKVFNKIYKINKMAFLLMVGDGEEKNEIIKMLHKNNLDNNYLILSNRVDIPDLLNAMDVFVFPSISEGLGISVLEAQKAKLPCIISEYIPNKAIISNLVTMLSLKDDPMVWANVILKSSKPQKIILNDESWNINKTIEELEKLYLLEKK